MVQHKVMNIEDRKNIERLWRAGLTQKQIASIYHTYVAAIRGVLVSLSLDRGSSGILDVSDGRLSEYARRRKRRERTQRGREANRRG